MGTKKFRKQNIEFTEFFIFDNQNGTDANKLGKAYFLLINQI